jgi:effector-binding domain-containing protein
MNQTEQPDYQIVTSHEHIEIRDYPQIVFAQVEVSGARKEAIREGFKILADYIFGNNISSKKMETTTTFVETPSEKIAMTAPVMQEKHMNHWKVRFVMPKKYTLEMLPKPNNQNIHLFRSPAKRLAVIRFSGLASDENIEQHTQELRNYIITQKWEPLGSAVLAFYNPPWTLPFLRRNEIMIEIGTVQ